MKVINIDESLRSINNEAKKRKKKGRTKTVVGINLRQTSTKYDVALCGV